MPLEFAGSTHSTPPPCREEGENAHSCLCDYGESQSCRYRGRNGEHLSWRAPTFFSANCLEARGHGDVIRDVNYSPADNRATAAWTVGSAAQGLLGFLPGATARVACAVVEGCCEEASEKAPCVTMVGGLPTTAAGGRTRLRTGDVSFIEKLELKISGLCTLHASWMKSST